MRSISFSTFISAMTGTVPVTALAGAKTGAAAEMACKAQDPLGDVKAIRTDNTICLGGGPDDGTAYGFQIQPVYAIEYDTSYNLLARADDGNKWGLSVIIMQYVFSLKSSASIKRGIGPQVPVRT